MKHPILEKGVRKEKAAYASQVHSDVGAKPIVQDPSFREARLTEVMGRPLLSGKKPPPQGVQRPRTNLCTQNWPSISGFLYFFCLEEIFLLRVAGSVGWGRPGPQVIPPVSFEWEKRELANGFRNV